jgi:group I intron endonuclease
MKKIGYIYKITNPNGKIYIGQTINLSNRKSAYRNLNIKGQELIKNSIIKYGWDNHIFEVIGEFDVETLNSKEIELINEYNSYYLTNKNGMNMTLGGDGCRGRKDSEETKIKRSSHHIGKKRSEATKELMRLAKIGKPSNILGNFHSEQTKKKMSENKLNKKQTTETINKRVKSMKDNFLKKHGSILQYDINTKLLVREWLETPKEIMNQTNFNDSSIIKCLKNKRKSAFGFFWKYKIMVINE